MRLRDLHSHYRGDPSYRPFNKRLREASQQPLLEHQRWSITMLHLRHQGPHGLAFLTELFNLSVAGINIPAIWKNSVIIPILKAGKPCGLGHSYSPISLLCLALPAVKILERIILPPIMEALGTRPFQHGFIRSNQGIPLPWLCCPSLLGWSLVFYQHKLPYQNHSHSGGHLEGVRHHLSPPPHRDDPELRLYHNLVRS